MYSTNNWPHMCVRSIARVVCLRVRQTTVLRRVHVLRRRTHVIIIRYTPVSFMSHAAITRTGDGTTIVFHTRADFNNCSGNNNAYAFARRLPWWRQLRAVCTVSDGPCENGTGTRAREIRPLYAGPHLLGNAIETSRLRTDNG